MTSEEKLQCKKSTEQFHFAYRLRTFLAVVFDCYDYEKTGTLSMEEMSLALEFTLTGCCKLCNNATAPSGEDLDEFTAQVSVHLIPTHLFFDFVHIDLRKAGP